MASQPGLDLAQQQLTGRAHQLLPARVQAQFHVVAAAGMVTDPAHGSYRLFPAGIDQHPAPAMALIEQIFDAPIQQLPQPGRAGCLLQMPEQGGAAAVQRGELQVGRQGPVEAALAGEGAPAPQPVGAQGLEALHSQHGQAAVIEGRSGGDPADRSLGLLYCLAHQGGG